MPVRNNASQKLDLFTTTENKWKWFMKKYVILEHELSQHFSSNKEL